MPNFTKQEALISGMEFLETLGLVVTMLHSPSESLDGILGYTVKGEKAAIHAVLGRVGTLQEYAQELPPYVTDDVRRDDMTLDYFMPDIDGYVRATASPVPGFSYVFLYEDKSKDLHWDFYQEYSKAASTAISHQERMTLQ